jgi:LPXTG-motif cell wall-anchored protein
MRRFFVAACGAALVMLAPGIASAQCIQLPGERADRLAAIAAGHVDAEVAFIGKVVDRRDSIRRGRSVWTPIVFDVVATFKGSPLRERTVLINGGCMKGQCVLNSEEQGFKGHRLQLVFADRRTKVGLVSTSACTDAGPLSASEVRLMLHPSTLPMTGGQQVSVVALLGSGALLLGCVLLLWERRIVAEPTTTSPSYKTTV